MTLWTSKEAIQATNGKTGSWNASGISIDTRTLNEGDLFIALKGPNSDGHDYAAQALEHGAAAIMVDHIPEGVSEDQCLLVEDTLKALGDLGRLRRNQVNAVIIAVTGSVGKTSTKDMLDKCFSETARTHASQKSYNNHWGVPLTLALMPKNTQVGVFEIGMNHANEISPLSKMVKPDITLITAVEAVHIENFEDGEQGIAKAKAEIFDGLKEGSKAIIRQDHKWYEFLSQKARDSGAIVYTYGKEQGHDNLSDSLHAPINDIHVTQSQTIFETYIQDGVQGMIKLNVSGEHHAYNSAAVLLCGALVCQDVNAGVLKNDLEINMDLFELAILNWEQRDGRGKQERIQINLDEPPIILIDEHYNASPVAMCAAFQALGRINPEGKGRRIAVLGDMAELGADVIQYHKELLPELIKANIDLVFTAGPNMKHLYDELPEEKRGTHADTPLELCDTLKNTIKSGDAILVKGSRGGAEKPKMQILIDTIQSLAI